MDDWHQKIFDELEFLTEKQKTLDIEKTQQTVLHFTPEQQKPLWDIIEKAGPIPNKSPQLLANILKEFLKG